MDHDLHQLGEDLITTAARLVRWMPTDGWAMSLASARILARLSDAGPSRISDIAALEKSSQPTITNHVKRLEAAGLVDRSTDPRDARAWVIGLTDAGIDQLRQMRSSFGDNLQPYLAPLSDADLHALRDGIEVMRRMMAQPRAVAPDKMPQ